MKLVYLTAGGLPDYLTLTLEKLGFAVVMEEEQGGVSFDSLLELALRCDLIFNPRSIDTPFHQALFQIARDAQIPVLHELSDFYNLANAT